MKSEKWKIRLEIKDSIICQKKHVYHNHWDVILVFGKFPDVSGWNCESNKYPFYMFVPEHKYFDINSIPLLCFHLKFTLLWVFKQWSKVLSSSHSWLGNNIFLPVWLEASKYDFHWYWRSEAKSYQVPNCLSRIMCWLGDNMFLLVWLEASKYDFHGLYWTVQFRQDSRPEPT